MNSEGVQIFTAEIVVAFVFITLLIGGVLREVNKHFKLPYTPMLLFVGIIIGGWREYLGKFNQGVFILE